MSIVVKGFVLVLILGVGIAVVAITWNPHMTHKIGQGSSLKLRNKNEWSVTTSSPSNGYWPLTANSDELGLTLAIRSGRLFTKKTTENEWAYYTEIIYGDEFSLDNDGNVLMDGKVISPKKRTPLPLGELYEFEPDEVVNASQPAGLSENHLHD